MYTSTKIFSNYLQNCSLFIAGINALLNNPIDPRLLRGNAANNNDDDDEEDENDEDFLAPNELPTSIIW